MRRQAKLCSDKALVFSLCWSKYHIKTAHFHMWDGGWTRWLYITFTKVPSRQEANLLMRWGWLKQLSTKAPVSQPLAGIEPRTLTCQSSALLLNLQSTNSHAIANTLPRRATVWVDFFFNEEGNSNFTRQSIHSLMGNICKASVWLKGLADQTPSNMDALMTYMSTVTSIWG